jgi:hypothetical protein
MGALAGETFEGLGDMVGGVAGVGLLHLIQLRDNGTGEETRREGCAICETR